MNALKLKSPIKTQQMINMFGFILIVMTSVSCTTRNQTPPKLNSNKQLQYSFQQPQRKVLSGKQSSQLGQPDLQSINSKSNTYYSANGNICRHLSNSKTVCHIGGQWRESVAIIAIGR
jgi:hypothetical protein